MAGATIKLMTNVPVTGTVDYCDFIPTKNPSYSDQIALRGKWDGAGDGRIYLHLALEQDLQKLGIIGQRQYNGNYPLLVKDPKVKLCKIEQGSSKKTVVELIGHAGALAQQVQQHAQTAQPVQQPSLYNAPLVNPPAVTVAPRSAPTLEELTLTFDDSIRAVTEIINKNKMQEEFSVATAAASLFEQRCKYGLFEEKKENVPF